MSLPRIQLLIALVLHFRAAVAALAIDQRFKVRHHRHRETGDKERPCVAVKFVSDDTSGISTGSDDSGPSMSETVMELSVDLVTDADLAPEEDVDVVDDPDPTGLEGPSRLIKVLLDSLFTAGEQDTETLGGLVWQIRYEGTSNDDDSTPDTGRIVERIVLVYRVRADDPTYLLTGN